MAQKRSIFEDVADGSTPKSSPPTGGMIDQGRTGARAAIRVWLAILFALVVLMIGVGGLTRLTDSGLSITEWRPFSGAFPPMNAADWQAEFAKYQAIPEFQIQNKWMEIGDFKAIYWWEWGHRQLGRVIGLVWAIGFFGFLALKKIPVGWAGRLAFVGALGGLQGAVGWWMVSSGLSGGRIDVASYRLAIHLGLAFVILGFLAWYMMSMGREERDLMQARRLREAKLFSLSTGWMHFVFLQILIGAMVAGIDAGRAYTDWPLMGGKLIPPGALVIEPIWRNFFENPGLVQFIHRCVGYVLAGFTIMVWMRGRRSANTRTQSAYHMAGLAIAAQVALGIMTVVMAAPWQIAIVHQLMAVLIWVLILRTRFLTQYPLISSIQRS